MRARLGEKGEGKGRRIYPNRIFRSRRNFHCYAVAPHKDFSPTSIVRPELLPSRHVLGLLGIFSAFAATGCIRSITVHATTPLGVSAAGRPSSTCSAAWHSAKRNKT